MAVVQASPVGANSMQTRAGGTARWCRGRRYGFAWWSPGGRQTHVAAFDRLPPLDRELPEVFIERQQHPSIRLRDLEQRNIARAGEVRPAPRHIVTGLPQRLDCRQGKVLVKTYLTQEQSALKIEAWPDFLRPSTK